MIMQLFKKMSRKFLLVFMFFVISLAGCSNSASDLIGKWQITKKPKWVKNHYLACKSDIFQFMNEGACVWGTAGGTYKIMENNNIRVNFPMQAITPGYVGVLSYAITGDKLVLFDSARKDSIILKRIKNK